jgi:hypothetical protein
VNKLGVSTSLSSICSLSLVCSPADIMQKGSKTLQLEPC